MGRVKSAIKILGIDTIDRGMTPGHKKVVKKMARKAIRQEGKALTEMELLYEDITGSIKAIFAKEVRYE